MCGPTGVGKSHLANAIAIEALKRNFHVLAKPTHRLLYDLQIARSNGSHPRHLARILACDLLVLDDFGLQSISPQAAQDLYEIITERYEHGSMIITSNRAFEEWGEIFANDLLASAALDRLTHHAHTLVIRGDSFRQRSRRKENPCRKPHQNNNPILFVLSDSVAKNPAAGCGKVDRSALPTFPQPLLLLRSPLPSKATLHRLTHPVHILIIRGDSFRQRSRRKEFCLEYFNF